MGTTAQNSAAVRRLALVNHGTTLLLHDDGGDLATASVYLGDIHVVGVAADPKRWCIRDIGPLFVGGACFGIAPENRLAVAEWVDGLNCEARP